jgi:hypothetical protein
VILSLVLLTLRVSYYELEETILLAPTEEEDDDAVPSSGGGYCACLCSARNPPKDEHFGEITVSTPKEEDVGGRSWCGAGGCFGSKQPPKDKHIGEIKVNKQVAVAATATAASTTAPAIQANTPSRMSSNDNNNNAAADQESDDSSSSYESGSFDEESLKA